MIKLEKTEVMGWEAAIRGMRNPMNSWGKSDSFECVENVPIFAECEDCPFNYDDGISHRCQKCPELTKYVVGPNDHELMMKLAAGGPTHAKYRRMIVVYVDITAPLYWWKEFDTYKVGTVANSCSTMHKIHEKEFTLEDFSTEHLFPEVREAFETTIISALNMARDSFVRKPHRKDYWWQMIQLLPSSYNQKRTVMLNYEVLAGLYPMRKNHKLDEWHVFCDWIEELPYSEIIIGSESVRFAKIGEFVAKGLSDGVNGIKED